MNYGEMESFEYAMFAVCYEIPHGSSGNATGVLGDIDFLGDRLAKSFSKQYDLV